MTDRPARIRELGAELRATTEALRSAEASGDAAEVARLERRLAELDSEVREQVEVGAHLRAFAASNQRPS